VSHDKEQERDPPKRNLKTPSQLEESTARGDEENEKREFGNVLIPKTDKGCDLCAEERNELWVIDLAEANDRIGPMPLLEASIEVDDAGVKEPNRTCVSTPCPEGAEKRVEKNHQENDPEEDVRQFPWKGCPSVAS
jgi:hypothetical protein